MIPVSPITDWTATALDPSPPFLSAMAPLATESGCVILASGGEHEEARRQILAALPLFTLTLNGDNPELVTNDSRTPLEGSPFGALDRILSRMECPSSAPPFGLYGYLSYDLKDHVETLSDTVVDDLALPLLHLHAPRVLIVEEEGRRTLFVGRTKADPPGTAESVRDEILERLSRVAPIPPCRPKAPTLSSNVEKDEFLSCVSEIRDRIRAGEIYQVNYSQRFSVGFSGSPYDLFLKMFEKNPAPFFCYQNEEDFQIASSSPERFLKIENGRAETRPIKGTIPRGNTAEDDLKNRKRLEESEKDGAELSMIVDLMRNDLGRVSKSGSVTVTDPCRIEAWTNVFHRVAVIESELAENVTAGRLLSATFPPGSVTGCPKIRAMEVIDELERVRRQVYTGAMGRIGFSGDLDLNVAIRTVIAKNARLHFSTGGGMVWDSDPESEYRETLHKAKTFFSVLDAQDPPTTPVLWMDGRFVAEDAATLPMDAPALLHGKGVFETLRVKNGEPEDLGAHAARLSAAVERLFNTSMPKVPYANIICRLVKKNDLQEREAACNLVAGMGKNGLHLMVRLTPYERRRYPDGIRLVTHKEPMESPMARMKTTNRLFYSRVLEEAKQNGADDGLILCPDGRISETAIANILAITGNTVLLPHAPVLPGITQERVLERLHATGFKTRTVPLFPRDLLSADLVLATSSLRGVVRVRSLDGIRLENGFDPTEIAEKLDLDSLS